MSARSREKRDELARLEAIERHIDEVPEGSLLRAAASTFVAFLLCGLVPLIPYLFGATDAFVPALSASAVVFFVIGSMKSRWSPQSWCRSGLETLAVGSVAAAVAYASGVLLRNLPG